MFARSPLMLIPGAMVLAACALAGAGVHEAAGPQARGAPGQGPVARCLIEVVPQGDGLTLRAILTAGSALSGDYRLTVAGQGNRIDQSGDFAAAEGRVATLAEAQLSGQPADYRADLTLTIAGENHACAHP